MSLSYEQVQLNLRVPAFMESTFLKAFDVGPEVLLIGVYGSSTTVAVLNASTLTKRWPPDMLSLDEPCKDVIAASQTIYAVDCSDNLYRLTHRIPDKYRNVSDLRDDGREKYFWKKLPGFSNLAAIAGLQFGIIVIEESKGSYYLTAYNVQEEPLPMVFIPLGSTPGNYFITSFSAAVVQVELAAQLLGDRHSAATDLVVFSKPSGYVYLLPIVSESQDIKPVELHLERNQPVKMAAMTEDGETLVLAYEFGKIVLIFLRDKNRASACLYPSISFQTLVSTGSSNEILLLSSDFAAVNVLSICERNELIIRPVNKPLPGIRFLFLLNQSKQFLAFSCFGSIYELTVDSLADEVAPKASVILEDIHNVGSSKEQLMVDLERANKSLLSVENEQFGSYDFVINKLSDATVEIKNQSPRMFNKDQWAVHIEAKSKENVALKVVALESDFEANGKLNLDFLELVETGNFQSMTFSLVGTVAAHFRLLIVQMGILEIDSNVNDPIGQFIKQKLEEILKKRR